MNEHAAYLGAHDTVAKDPSGLDAPGQTSSAYDLALIGRAALELKDFRTYVATKQVDFPGRVDPKTKKRATYKINNHNKLLYNYEGTIGRQERLHRGGQPHLHLGRDPRRRRPTCSPRCTGWTRRGARRPRCTTGPSRTATRPGAVGELVRPGTRHRRRPARCRAHLPTLTTRARRARPRRHRTRALPRVPAAGTLPARPTRCGRPPQPSPWSCCSSSWWSSGPVGARSASRGAPSPLSVTSGGPGSVCRGRACRARPHRPRRARRPPRRWCGRPRAGRRSAGRRRCARGSCRSGSGAGPSASLCSWPALRPAPTARCRGRWPPRPRR